MRVLWLFGPPGVGKSVTAWELLDLLSDGAGPTGYVDIDQLGMTWPEPDDESLSRAYVAESLAAVARVHARRGAANLVVSGVLDPDQLEVHRRALAEFDVALVRLAADEAELRRRMDTRGRYAEDWAGVLADARRHEAADHGLPVVRTDDGGPTQTARRVLDVARTIPASSSGEADDEPPPAGGDSATLITGCRVVGKSTVGWLAFTMARERQIPSAFVDLRQLGFRGRAGGPIDHELQAAAVSALWCVQVAHGHRLLLLNGTTAGPADAAAYAEALEGTPMTTIRLTAGTPALTARARARYRGEMAALAGDDLVGADDAYLEQVVADAATAQDEWSHEHADEHVLDTTALSATETARTVLDLVSRGR